ncbi:hypothetical protein [Microseira sp. BLCC-F43]|uniref:hypothetical protein n=1 Tax=Microseira sp. BLCC-F43 TaxID=3153602 RepID=UPI0035B9164D
MKLFPRLYISDLKSQLKRTEVLIFWLLVTIRQQERWVGLEESTIFYGLSEKYVML